MNDRAMRLKIVTPSEIVVDVDARRIVAAAPNGAFGVLPRHADYVSQLKPGVLTYETAAGVERYVGVYGGTLVKCGDEVLISARDAVESDQLDRLQARIRKSVDAFEEQERHARAALARLEAGIVRRFIDLEQAGP